MTSRNYLELKKDVMSAVGQTPRHDEILTSLKNIYKGEINSQRRFEQIKSIANLLHVLEIRDVLAEDRVGPLKLIAERLNQTKDILLKKIFDYEESLNFQEGNIIYSQLSPQKENLISVINIPAPDLSTKKKNLLHKKFTTEIGSKWKDVGRFLKINESELIRINNEYRTLQEKSSALFNVFLEEKADPQNWFFLLSNALVKARRKDLSKELQRIMMMNI